jgi:hypothetical protein
MTSATYNFLDSRKMRISESEKLIPKNTVSGEALSLGDASRARWGAGVYSALFELLNVLNC